MSYFGARVVGFEPWTWTQFGLESDFENLDLDLDLDLKAKNLDLKGEDLEL